MKHIKLGPLNYANPDTANPFMILLKEALESQIIKVSSPEKSSLFFSQAFVWNWPEYIAYSTSVSKRIFAYLRAALWFLHLKLGNKKLILLAHNSRPHITETQFSRFFSHLFQRNANAVFLIGPAQPTATISGKISRLPHPNFPTSQNYVRRHKDASGYIATVLDGKRQMDMPLLRKISEVENVRAIARSITSEDTPEKIQVLANGKVTNDALDEFIIGSRFFLLPWLESSNSGFAHYALSRGVRVLCSSKDAGCLYIAEQFPGLVLPIGDTIPAIGELQEDAKEEFRAIYEQNGVSFDDLASQIIREIYH